MRCRKGEREAEKLRDADNNSLVSGHESASMKRNGIQRYISDLIPFLDVHLGESNIYRHSTNSSSLKINVSDYQHGYVHAKQKGNLKSNDLMRII